MLNDNKCRAPWSCNLALHPGGLEAGAHCARHRFNPVVDLRLHDDAER